MGRRVAARQRECRKITKVKAKQQRRKAALRRFGILFGAIAVLYGLGLGLWFAHNGGAERLAANLAAGARDRFYRMTADAGFTVQHVYLEGRNHTGMDKIHEALGVRSGTPIFSCSPQALRARLEGLDRVQYAEVERMLPSTLHIHIVEREPIAIWQHNGELRLIDNSGRVMEELEPGNYASLPVVVGANAPSHAPALFATMAGSQDLLREVAAAIRVGERRWNLRFKNGMEVKLPEHDITAAWATFARMQAEEEVMEKAVATVDLRLAGKVFIKLTPVSADANAPAPSRTLQGDPTPGAHET